MGKATGKRCSVFGCDRRGGHQFPKFRPYKLKWLLALELNEEEIRNSSIVCHKHFSESDYKVLFAPGSLGKGKRLRLKRTAVPSIDNPGQSPSYPELLALRDDVKNLSNPSSVGDLDLKFIKIPRAGKIQCESTQYVDASMGLPSFEIPLRQSSESAEITFEIEDKGLSQREEGAIPRAKGSDSLLFEVLPCRDSDKSCRSEPPRMDGFTLRSNKLQITTSTSNDLLEICTFEATSEAPQDTSDAVSRTKVNDLECSFFSLASSEGDNTCNSRTCINDLAENKENGQAKLDQCNARLLDEKAELEYFRLNSKSNPCPCNDLELRFGKTSRKRWWKKFSNLAPISKISKQKHGLLPALRKTPLLRSLPLKIQERPKIEEGKIIRVFNLVPDSCKSLVAKVSSHRGAISSGKVADCQNREVLKASPDLSAHETSVPEIEKKNDVSLDHLGSPKESDALGILDDDSVGYHSSHDCNIVSAASSESESAPPEDLPQCSGPSSIPDVRPPSEDVLLNLLSQDDIVIDDAQGNQEAQDPPTTSPNSTEAQSPSDDTTDAPIIAPDDTIETDSPLLRQLLDHTYTCSSDTVKPTNNPCVAMMEEIAAASLVELGNVNSEMSNTIEDGIVYDQGFQLNISELPIFDISGLVVSSPPVQPRVEEPTLIIAEPKPCKKKRSPFVVEQIKEKAPNALLRAQRRARIIEMSWKDALQIHQDAMKMLVGKKDACDLSAKENGSGKSALGNFCSGRSPETENVDFSEDVIIIDDSDDENGDAITRKSNVSLSDTEKNGGRIEIPEENRIPSDSGSSLQVDLSLVAGNVSQQPMTLEPRAAAELDKWLRSDSTIRATPNGSKIEISIVRKPSEPYSSLTPFKSSVKSAIKNLPVFSMTEKPRVNTSVAQKSNAQETSGRSTSNLNSILVGWKGCPNSKVSQPSAPRAPIEPTSDLDKVPRRVHYATEYTMLSSSSTGESLSNDTEISLLPLLTSDETCAPGRGKPKASGKESTQCRLFHVNGMAMSDGESLNPSFAPEDLLEDFEPMTDPLAPVDAVTEPTPFEDLSLSGIPINKPRIDNSFLAARIERPSWEEEFQCLECTMLFNSELAYSEHMETEHPPKETLGVVYFCNFCSFETRCDAELRSHIDSLHRKQTKNCCPKYINDYQPVLPKRVQPALPLPEVTTLGADRKTLIPAGGRNGIYRRTEIPAMSPVFQDVPIVNQTYSLSRSAWFSDFPTSQVP